MKRSTIGWTDFSGGNANFTVGCMPISAGCQNCYARAIIEERGGKDFFQVRCYPEKLRRLGNTQFESGGVPFRRGPGSKPTVFVCDLGDLFHIDVPTGFIASALRTMIRRQDVDWQILTKRPWRMADVICRVLHEDCLEVLPDNIWPGVTVEAVPWRGRIDDLRQIPSARRFVSVEPMLEPGVLTAPWLAGISWVICGAESGPRRRPFERWWAEELYDECHGLGIPFFGKQDSGLRPGMPLFINGKIIHEFPI